ncbi:MAG: transketolase [Acidobacteriota bacterium]|nr:MAG: transketolase [Acidobacteriota bacterium]
MSWSPDGVDVLCVNTIRTLAIDAVEQANSGHPGLPLGAAPMAYVLWQRHLRFDPAAPAWPDRDRFVLSAGHGSMLLYALLHLSGYALGLDEIKRFRQWASRTPGHPEAGHTPGVEATTGPLGQGTAVAVGMALAERMLAERFNRDETTLVDHHIYALVSDGDLMEGISAEAGSFAGHLGLGKLIYLYDSNDVSLDGPTSMTFTEDVAARYRAYGWQVLRVDDGDTDLVAIDQALDEARSETTRPSLIVVRTTIGYGSPNKAGSHEAHGSPLGEEEVRLTKKRLGWIPEARFVIPEDASTRFGEAALRGRELRERWQARFREREQQDPGWGKQWRQSFSGQLEDSGDLELPHWEVGEKAATRAAAGAALQALAKHAPWLVGGDADLSGSTKSVIKSSGWIERGSFAGRNIHFGVREHAMGAIANGLAYHGGLRPLVSTFLVFSDYMRPPVRLASLDGLPVIYVWTHDSIGVGEDGPTHQPVEQVAALRAIPNLHVFRPGDPHEAVAAWLAALRRTEGPTALVLSRQGLPALAGSGERAREGVARGAYVLSDAPNGKPEAIVLATGSELQLAVGAQKMLAEERIGVRVVSMPCWEAFAEQAEEYREAVLPSSVRARVAVEAGTTLGWHRWVGDAGRALGVDRFGASAPGSVNMEKYGLTVSDVSEAVRAVLNPDYS